MRRTVRLTEGDVFTTLLFYSIPFLLSNLLQALYGASDLFMVGRFADSVSVSAVSTGSQVMQAITSLAIGLTTGGTIRVARQFGARQTRELADTAVSICGIFGVLSVLLWFGVALFTDPICVLMRVPPEAFAETKLYLRTCAAGIVFIVGFNVAGCILRGLGDSKTPLLFMALSCITNVSTDLLFVGVLRMRAYGAAVSTVLAQGFSLLLSGLYMLRKDYLGKLTGLRPRPRLSAAMGTLSVGLPIAMQEGLTNLSFLFITAFINRMGLTASASVGVVEKLIMFSMLPPTAFASAVAAMAAQNKGAGKHARTRRCLRAGIGLSLLFGATCFLCAQINAPGLIRIFTGDPAVVAAAAPYFRSYSFDVILVCFVFCLNSYFSGVGHSVFPLAHGLLATFLIRIPLCWLLTRPGTTSLLAAGFAAPAASAFSLLLCLLYLRRTTAVRPDSAIHVVKASGHRTQKRSQAQGFPRSFAVFFCDCHSRRGANR